jgi:hypothetical protein
MHFLDALLAELSESSVILVLLPKLTTEVFLCALLAPAQCPPGRASQNSSKLLSELTTEFLLQCTTMPMLNAHWAEPYRTPKRFCLQLCLSYTALPPRYLTTLRSSSSELLIPALVPQNVFV